MLAGCRPDSDEWRGRRSIHECAKQDLLLAVTVIGRRPAPRWTPGMSASGCAGRSADYPLDQTRLPRPAVLRAQYRDWLLGLVRVGEDIVLHQHLAGFFNFDIANE